MLLASAAHQKRAALRRSPKQVWHGSANNSVNRENWLSQLWTSVPTLESGREWSDCFRAMCVKRGTR